MNFKFDIQKLTDQFNGLAEWSINNMDYVTIDQMKEMIQLKAFELGYKWLDGTDTASFKINYLFIYEDKSITWANDLSSFESSEHKEADLSFFSLQPGKVTIEINRADLDKIKNGFDIKVVK